MVAKAKEELEQEVLVKEDEKDKYLSERAPPLHMSGMSIHQLQVSGSSSPSLPSYRPHNRCPIAPSPGDGV